jgi:hypothetical protein
LVADLYHIGNLNTTRALGGDKTPKRVPAIAIFSRAAILPALLHFPIIIAILIILIVSLTLLYQNGIGASFLPPVGRLRHHESAEKICPSPSGPSDVSPIPTFPNACDTADA